jgi:SAM-dependent methyltransferase
VLDFGCGKGEYITAFRQLKLKVVGVDSRVETQPGYHKCDIEKEHLPFVDNTFDVIFSKSTIEHIHNPDHLFNELYRVLKPGGKVILMTPDWETNYKEFYIDYSHVTPYTRKSLREALLIFGFKNVNVEQFYQLPLLWRCPHLKFLAALTRKLIPDQFKWKDKEQTKHRTWIRFSKELMLLGIGEK